MAPKRRDVLDHFGKLVVTEVYDRSCGVVQRVLSGRMRPKHCVELFEAYRSLDPQSADTLRRFVMFAIDQTFAQFLNFFDAHEIPIPFETETGETVDIQSQSDGLAAEPYNEWGWIAKFSKFQDRIEPLQ